MHHSHSLQSRSRSPQKQDSPYSHPKSYSQKVHVTSLKKTLLLCYIRSDCYFSLVRTAWWRWPFSCFLYTHTFMQLWRSPAPLIELDWPLAWAWALLIIEKQENEGGLAQRGLYKATRSKPALET